ncbi:MAG: dockerin type I repeat-containing protein, partial [candidate division Zixibacteria bacterium]
GVTIDATDGEFSVLETDLVYAFADSIETIGDSARPGDIVRVDVSVRNYVSLTSLTIPFTWAGDLNLKLNSVSTVGLRTEFMESHTFTHYSGSARQATYFFNPAADPLFPVLPPGDGPVLSLYFKIPLSAPFGTDSVVIGNYGDYLLEFGTEVGTYVPELGETGIVASGNFCLAGDVNNDGFSADISDLTYLISYLFGNGPAPEDMNTANVNGIGGIDISDVTHIVNFMFLDGPDPECPSPARY